LLFNGRNFVGNCHIFLGLLAVGFPITGNGT
jgi:hypothetical protein